MYSRAHPRPPPEVLPAVAEVALLLVAAVVLVEADVDGILRGDTYMTSSEL